MARRAVAILALSFVLALLLLQVLIHGAAPSAQEDQRSVLPVKAATFPGPPDTPGSPDIPASPNPPSSDARQIWATATRKDPSPVLANNATTRTFGGGVALTFDDGPDPRTTPRILDILKQHHLKATFFVLGYQVRDHPALLRRIVEEGHTIGNHTYDHSDMSTLSAQQMRNELQSTQKAVDEALGYHYPMVLMRPPYGNPYIAGKSALPVFQRVVREQRLIPVIWTIDPSDYLYRGDPLDIIRGVARADKAEQNVRRGKGDEVVLLHDTQPQTVRALPVIINYYEKSNRQFTNVKELLVDKYGDHQ